MKLDRKMDEFNQLDPITADFCPCANRCVLSCSGGCTACTGLCTNVCTGCQLGSQVLP